MQKLPKSQKGLLMAELLRLLPVSVDATDVSVDFVAALVDVDSTTVFSVVCAEDSEVKERTIKKWRFSDSAGRRLKSEYCGALGPGRTFVSFEVFGFELGSTHHVLRVRTDLGEFDLAIEE